MKRTLLSSLVVGAALSATPVMAQTFSSNQTGQFNVKMQIQGQCILQTASDLNFGSTGIINANIDQSSTLVVQCTNGTPYNVALNYGANGTSAATRAMTAGGTDQVKYALFRDVARTIPWGNTATDAYSDTGKGSTVQIPVYGRVPAQNAVAPGNYSDTITVTVNY